MIYEPEKIQKSISSLATDNNIITPRRNVFRLYEMRVKTVWRDISTRG